MTLFLLFWLLFLAYVGSAVSCFAGGSKSFRCFTCYDEKECESAVEQECLGSGPYLCTTEVVDGKIVSKKCGSKPGSKSPLAGLVNGCVHPRRSNSRLCGCDDELCNDSGSNELREGPDHGGDGDAKANAKSSSRSRMPRSTETGSLRILQIILVWNL